MDIGDTANPAAIHPFRRHLPLMSAGLARLWPDKKGSIVSMLYFSNSLGAAAACWLAVCFGAVCRVAGCRYRRGFVNFFVAAAVWILGHLFDNIAAPLSATRSVKTALSSAGRLLLLTAALPVRRLLFMRLFGYECCRCFSVLPLIRLKLCFRCLFWAWPSAVY